MMRSRRKSRFPTRLELRLAFENESGEKWPAILSPAKLAALLDVSVSTLYAWIADGRFDGAFRKRGKHIRFWRDRAIAVFFDGPNWSSNRNENETE